MPQIAKVLVDIYSQGISDELFDYLIPPDLEIEIGDLVYLKFGLRLCRGFVVEICDHSKFTPEQLKPVEGVFHKKLFGQDYLKLLQAISDFYLSDFLTTLKGVLPLGLLSSFQERIILKSFSGAYKLSPIEEQIVSLLYESKQKSLALNFIKKQIKSSALNKALERLQAKNIIEKTVLVKKATKSANYTSNQNFTSSLKSLNPEQEQIYEKLLVALKSQNFGQFLLHGITGSGKTEIYLKAAKHVLEQGKQVIYLVPEIALSVQLLERVKAAFSEEILTLWHSNLSDKQRLTAWNKCLIEGPHLILGARSAIFAPVQNLGLIIIDEEHDASYKSGNRPFYDARLIAEKRAELSKAVLLSGSATPNIVSFHKAQNTNSLLQLNSRFYQAEMPVVQIIDMRRELAVGNKSIFSRQLKRSLEECIQKKEQAILLLNRRGHSNYVFCRDCGYAVFCDNCSVPMVFHLNQNILRCHHCHEAKEVYKICPNCQSPRIKQTGLGTQKLEQEVIKHFPTAEVLRLDRDVSSKRHGMDEIWEKLNTNPDKCQILVGTQLVAKGFDLPRVTLVGVVHAEGGLYMPDYSSTERSFQLLTQAAGRAGRHQKIGKVVFQTYNPENEVIQFASKHDYKSFYEDEIDKREQALYPPFVQLSRLLILHEDQQIAELEASQIAKLIKTEFPNIQILGPASCPIEKLHKLYRWHILLKTHELDILKILQAKIINNLKLKARLNLDIQPVSLL